MGFLIASDPESILDTVKGMLGTDPDYNAFDIDIIAGINSALMALNQLGVGPDGGMRITGRAETWSDLLGERKDLDSVKSYIYMKVKLMFDPPSSSFVADSMKELISEFEWRLNVQAEGGGS